MGMQVAEGPRDVYDDHDYKYDGVREMPEAVEREAYARAKRRFERAMNVLITELEVESREGWLLPAEEAAMPKSETEKRRWNVC